MVIPSLPRLIKSMQLAYGRNMIGEILEKEIPIAKKLREHIKN